MMGSTAKKNSTATKRVSEAAERRSVTGWISPARP
jgi:hypothetical protein